MDRGTPDEVVGDRPAETARGSEGAGGAVLAVDAHNVQTHFGLFEGKELLDDWWTETEADATPDSLAADLAGMLAMRDLDFARLRGSIVSSTVPNLTRAWPRVGERYLGHPMLVVGSGLRTGMPIRIQHPGELGANRLVNAVAAYERVRRACIVVDFSTAIAFDVVSGGGEYMGSVFAPGLDISFDSLIARTASLPATTLERPVASLAGTTEEAMRFGTVYGAAGLCDGIVDRIKLEMDDDAAVLATGPRASFITEFCDTVENVDPLLTLEGLRIIHERNG
jgi:type III pantothenate kinase